MRACTRNTVKISLIVAFGGFLMGFDASVISGVVPFIETQFALGRFALGWSVASLTVTATLAMLAAGPLSDRLGRRPVLLGTAAVFALSAVASAVAPDFRSLIAARMMGGFAVGAALIVAPMYIAEISPAAVRGRMVSLNQLNIVIGISAAFFSNYLIVRLGPLGGEVGPAPGAEAARWRWMLGVEALPAVAYLLSLVAVPESPRWLAMRGRAGEALRVLERFSGRARAREDLRAVQESLVPARQRRASFAALFRPAFRLVLTVGIAVAVLQQITGINAIFFYAPMLFAQSGIGTDAAFLQAVLVGLVNTVFTVFAIILIDRVGRRPLLGYGLAGIAGCMLLLSWEFASATYTLEAGALALLEAHFNTAALQGLVGHTWNSDVAFREAIAGVLGNEVFQAHQSRIIGLAIDMNPRVVLAGVLGFVASFAISIGPVMWVLFSELFPNWIRGFAISFVGVVNSTVSFIVQLVFPWELQYIGGAGTFLIYALFAMAGMLVILRVMPETRGLSLERLEAELVDKQRRMEP